MNNINLLTKKSMLVAVLATPLFLGAVSVQAEEAAKEPAPDFTYTFNLGIYSDYMFRGVKTADDMALQGGFDLAHSSGFYAGTWWSNINPAYFGKGLANIKSGEISEGNQLETDWYVGWAKTFESGFGLNFLANYYYYPESENNPGTDEKYDTLEVSAAVTYKYLTYTFFYIPTDYYGAKTSTGGDTEGAYYNELKVIYPLPFGGLNLKAKVGYQETGDLGIGCGGATVICDGGQGDWAVGINRDFTMPTGGTPLAGFNAGMEYTSTFSQKNDPFYRDTANKNLNGPQLWFYVKRTW